MSDHLGRLGAEVVEPYLRSIAADEEYRQRWEFYTSTDAVGQLREPEQGFPGLDLGLMVELMQPQQKEGAREPELAKKTERLPVLEGIRKYEKKHVLLTGRPGSGKSTALLRLLVDCAELAIVDPSAKIPVLVELRYLDAERPSMLKRIGAFLRSHQLDLSDAVLKAALTKGQLLLLIDGINELPSDAARRAVAQFRKDYRQASMIFTTRDVAIGGDVGIEKKLEMQPLSESQMRQFVQAYLPEQGESMLRQLQGRLREVGQTPLLLWMLSEVFKGLKKIPPSLGLLFRCFAKEHNKLKLKQGVPVSEGFRHWQPELLQQLAFTMMQGEPPTELRVTMPRQEAEAVLAEFLQGKVECPAQRAKEWLEDLLEHHLIQPVDRNQLEFHHQLLQGYYAAEHLLRRLPGLSDEELKQDYLNYLKWTESLALMLAIVEEEAQALRVVKLALETDLMLGARLTGNVKLAFHAMTVALINTQKLLPLLKLKCLAASHSDAAIPYLLTALTDSNSDIRRSAAEALGKLGSEAAIPGLLIALKDSDPYIRSSVAALLGKLGSEAAIPGLLIALKDSEVEVGWSAANALKQLGSEEAISGLLIDLEHSDVKVRECAINALRILGSKAAVPGLLIALKDSDPYVRRSAASALGELGSKEAIPDLISVLKDLNTEVRESAVYALGKFHDDEAASSLLIALQDSNAMIFWSAVYVLVAFGSEAVIPHMLVALEDSDADVRWKAVDALGLLGSEAAIPGLHIALEDSDTEVRERAAEALGKLGSETAISGLLNALEDSGYALRGSAVEALGELGSEAAIPGLLIALKDSHYGVRRSAAYALWELDSSIPLPDLWQLCLDGREELLSTIAAIQDRCKIYNHEIWQDAIKAERSRKQMANESKNDFSGAVFYGPVNFGSNPTGDFIATQNNYAADLEVKSAIANLQTLIAELQTQHSQVSTEAEAEGIIEAKFTEIKLSQNSQLTTLRKQLLNPERHWQAIKAALGEVAKHYLEESVWAKTTISYFDKLSEDPSHGA